MEIINTYKNASSLTENFLLKEFRHTIPRYNPLDKLHLKAFKRSMDITLSVLVIIFILSWIFPALFILSKFFSRGSLVFVQKRIGINNILFNCYKFRTIKPEKESLEKFNPILLNDTRLTKLGKLLRRSNLDELPQFINVLKGEMSIIGPRPHAIAYENIYNNSIEGNNLRYTIKPGITGWAQIHGLRGDVLDEEENKLRAGKRVQFDLWYIKNWSLILDIKIIISTILLILKGKPKSV